MKEVLVAGAGGYIGTWLVKALLKKNYRVRGLDRYFFGKELLGEEVLSHPEFKLIQKDTRLIKPEDIKGCEMVFDLAGLSNDPSCELDPFLTQDINFRGAENIIQCAKKVGVKRYLYSSSCSVYGTGQGTSLNEKSECRPVSAYAKAKIDVEKRALAECSDKFKVTILRNATIYGFSSRMRFDLVVNLMTLTAWRDGKIFILGGGNQWRPLIHVQDVVEAFIRIAENTSAKVVGEVFNVGSDEQNYQVAHIARMIKSMLPKTVIETIADDPDKRTYNVSFEKLRRTVGFVPKRVPSDAITEIIEALESGKVDPNDLRTVTLKHYQYLLKAEKLVNELAIQGRMLKCA